MIRILRQLILPLGLLILGITSIAYTSSSQAAKELAKESDQALQGQITIKLLNDSLKLALF